MISRIRGVDALEVVVGERRPAGQLEVVVEAVLDGRAAGEGGAGPELEHRLGEHVGRRVADVTQRVGITMVTMRTVASSGSGAARSVGTPSTSTTRPPWPARDRSKPPGRPRSPPRSRWRVEPSGSVMVICDMTGDATGREPVGFSPCWRSRPGADRCAAPSWTSAPHRRRCATTGPDAIISGSSASLGSAELMTGGTAGIGSWVLVA